MRHMGRSKTLPEGGITKDFMILGIYQTDNPTSVPEHLCLLVFPTQ